MNSERRWEFSFFVAVFVFAFVLGMVVQSMMQKEYKPLYSSSRPWGFPNFTAETLPACTPRMEGLAALVLDGAAPDDVAIGGGNWMVFAACDGAKWQAIQERSWK